MQQQDATVTPLRWLSESQRNQLVARIRDACTCVLSEWSVARNGSLPSVRCTADRRPVFGSQFHVGLEPRVVVVWTFEPDTLRYLLHLPPGSQVSVHSTENFISQLELDLVTALSQQLLPDVVSEPITIRRASQGDASELNSKVVRHVFDIGGDGRASICQLELSPVLVDKLIPRSAVHAKTNLLARRAAIGNDVVTLSATLGKIELSFNELHGLREGDVLLMNQALNKPVTISTTTGQLVAEAMLGRHKTQLALQIATLATPGLAAKRSIR